MISRIIYSISHLDIVNDQNHNETSSSSSLLSKTSRMINQQNHSIIISTTKLSSIQNQLDNHHEKNDLRILPRSKRFIQRMPKTPKLQKHHSKSSSSSSSMMTNSNDGTQTLFELDNEKFGNISMVLASLLDHYDHNQRPGYSGPPAVITTNLEIRSMGPISELDMVCISVIIYHLKKNVFNFYHLINFGCSW